MLIVPFLIKLLFFNLLASNHLLLNRFKHINFLQTQSLASFSFSNDYFEKFLFLFCEKLAKFIHSKTCFVVIGSLQIC